MVSKSTGPLQTHEIEYAEKLWIRIIQETTPSENHMNKTMDNDGIWRINSRNSWIFTNFTSKNCKFHEKAA